jgi:hypothetical protein
MPRPRRLYYAYQVKHQYLLSLLPPDAPVRPSLKFESLSELTEFVRRKKALVYWWPPLSQQLLNESRRLGLSNFDAASMPMT